MVATAEWKNCQGSWNLNIMLQKVLHGLNLISHLPLTGTKHELTISMPTFPISIKAMPTWRNLGSFLSFIIAIHSKSLNPFLESLPSPLSRGLLCFPGFYGNVSQVILSVSLSLFQAKSNASARWIFQGAWNNGIKWRGELCFVLALPIGKWHWGSFQPSRSLGSTTIKGVGVDAKVPSRAIIRWMHEWDNSLRIYLPMDFCLNF